MVAEASKIEPGETNKQTKSAGHVVRRHHSCVGLLVVSLL